MTKMGSDNEKRTHDSSSESNPHCQNTYFLQKPFSQQKTLVLLLFLITTL